MLITKECKQRELVNHLRGTCLADPPLFRGRGGGGGGVYYKKVRVTSTIFSQLSCYSVVCMACEFQGMLTI